MFLKQMWDKRAQLRLAQTLIFAPIVVAGLLIIFKTVNTPNLDQWELVPMFQHLRAGHFIWHDVWQQHNEHRILIPNIILLASAFLTHWNVIVECFISLAAASASFWLLLKLLKNTAKDLEQTLPIFLPALLSLIWFSPVQVENWLWGWQLEWFLNVFGAVIVAYALSRPKDSTQKQLGLIIVGGLLAQFSLGNGTLLWPLVVIALVYRRLSPAKYLPAVAIGGLATTAYFWHYTTATYVSKTLIFKEPVIFIKYVLIYLGRPLTFLRTGALVTGAFLLITFIGLNTFLFLRRKQTFNKLLPFTALGTYALGSSVITAISRMGLGLSQAYSSRYTTISMLLPISLIVAFGFVGQDILKPLSTGFRNLLWSGAIAGTTLLLFSNAAWGIHSAAGHKRELENIKQCSHLAAPPESCLLLTYPNSTVVKARLEYLKQIRWGGY